MLWNPIKGLHLKTYSGPHNYEINDLAIHPNNNSFASVGGDKLVFYWDVSTGNILRKFQGHTQPINCVSFNPQLNVLISGSLDNTVRIWDIESRGRPGHYILSKEIQVLDKQKDSVSKIIVTDDEIIVSSLDGIIRVYDIRMGLVTEDDIGGNSL